MRSTFWCFILVLHFRILVAVMGRSLLQVGDTTVIRKICGPTKPGNCPFTVLSGTAITGYSHSNLFSNDMCKGFISTQGSDFKIRINLDAVYKSLELSYVVGQLDPTDPTQNCQPYLIDRTPLLNISLGIKINNTALCHSYIYSPGIQGTFIAKSCVGIAARYIVLSGPGLSGKFYALAKFHVNAICSTNPTVNCTLCAEEDRFCVCNSGSYCPVGSTGEIPCPAGSFCTNTSTISICERNFYCPTGSVAQQPCPPNSVSPVGSTSFGSCVCNSPNYLIAFNSIFGVKATGNDTARYTANMLFIIRNPILPQNSPLIGTKITYWTVTTTRACTIQPFWTRPSKGWLLPPSNLQVTMEQNYNPWGVGTAITVPSAGTYTFPWVTSIGSDTLNQNAPMNLGWYTAEGTNCVATDFSSTGMQHLASIDVSRLTSWWADWHFFPVGGVQGNFAISIHQAPSVIPSGMVCRSCDANFYRSSNTECTACSPIASSLAGSVSVTDCKCKPGYTESCTLCPEGTYISDSLCHVCAVGSYCPIGSFSEKLCLAGFYCPNTTSSIICVNGSYCPNGSTAERPCPAGFYCSTPATILSCEKNFYCPTGSIKQNPCPANSDSLAGSVQFGSCECKASTYLLAYSSLFGVTSGFVGIDARVFAPNTLFIIRNPILPRYSPLVGTRILSWTVTTVRGCTIQPFWTTPSRAWEVPTGEQNYLPWGVGTAVTVPSAGTYTFPWVASNSARGTDILDLARSSILDPTVMMNLGWYTTEGINCVSSSFSASGTQYLTVQTVSTLPAWWSVYYFQTFGGAQGDFAISLNHAPTSFPSVMQCNNCSLMHNAANACSSFCAAGFYFNALTSICSLCPAGKYSTESQSMQCLSCADARCDSGHYREGCGGVSLGTCVPCSICAAGRYSTCGGISAGSCIGCPLCGSRDYSTCGGFSRGECIPCAICDNGFYSTCGGFSAGECRTCMYCTAGSYAFACGNVSAGFCTQCTF
jgi:hypothetical protein